MHNLLHLFPNTIYTTMIPAEFSSILPFLYGQEVLTEGIDSDNYGERSKNSYVLDEPPCLQLKKYILNQVLIYGNELGYDYNEYRFGQSWVSYKHPGQHHATHSHPNSLISGVFYFGEDGSNFPAIKFHKLIGGMNISYLQPKMKQSIQDSKNTFSINFTPGLLILFPSYLYHSVPVNKTDKVRCSLAFNTVPTVGLGDETNLTELKF
jgi:uncharacterized protein (TIGR02466 family)